MSITQKIHKISLIVDANTKQLRSVNDQFKDIQKELARVTGKVDLLSTQFNASQTRMRNAVTSTAKTSQSAYSSMRNDIVRHIRQMESFIVGLYAVKSAYDVTLGRGHEFNKLIETQTIGMKLLITQNLSNVDSLGNMLSMTDKFTISQKEANKAIKIARDINLETPQNFAETLQIYKLIIPQVLKYGGSLEQAGQITKNIAVVSQAMGVEFQQLLATADSIMTGESVQSGLRRAMEMFGISNEIIKSTIETGGSVVDLFITKLGNADMSGIALANTWGGVVSKFVNIWDEIWAKVQEPMFESAKAEIVSFAKLLKDNEQSIIDGIQEIGELAYDIARTLITWKFSSVVLKQLSSMGKLFGELGKKSEWTRIQFSSIAPASSAMNAVFTSNINNMSTNTSTFNNVLRNVRGSILRLGTALKTLFISNAPLLAITAAFEAWYYITDKQEQKLADLAETSRSSLVEMARWGANIGKDKTKELRDGIAESEEKLNNLLTLQKMLNSRDSSLTFYQTGVKDEVIEGLSLSERYLDSLDDQKKSVNERILKEKQSLTTMKEALHTLTTIPQKLKDAVANQEAIRSKLDDQRTMYDELVAKKEGLLALDRKVPQLLENQITHHGNNIKSLETQLKLSEENITSFEKTGDAVYKTTQVLYDAAKAALELRNNIRDTELGMETQLIRARELRGEITEEQAIRLTGAEQLKKIQKDIADLGTLYGTEGADTNVLNNQANQLAVEYMKTQNDMLEQLNRSKERAGRVSERAGKASDREVRNTYRLNDAYRNLKDALDELATSKEDTPFFDFNKTERDLSALEKAFVNAQDAFAKLQEKFPQLQGLGVDEIEKLSGISDKSKETYLKAWQKVIDSETKLEDYKKSNLQKQQDLLKQTMLSMLDDISSGLREGKSLNESMSNLGRSATSGMKSSDDPRVSAAGYVIELIAGLLSSGVTQAQIDAAKGRSEWNDSSIANLQSAYEKAQYPMLEVTNKMSKYLRDMDKNFGAVALAITGKAATSGIDLTGVNVVDTAEYGFLGFSSETVQLIGAGLEIATTNFAEAINASMLDAWGYVSQLVTEESFWGLVSDTSIRIRRTDLPSSVVGALADTFLSGYQAVLTAAVSLGFSEENISDALNQATIDIGKIDLTGLSPQEVNDRLSAVFSEVFSGVIDQIDALSALTDRYAQSSEYALETLGRIALEFDQASFQFGLIGKTFSEGVYNAIETIATTSLVEVVDSSSWFNTLLDQQINSSFSTIWSSLARTTTETITTYTDIIVEKAYTAQMQILDIVESVGGLDSFNDAMSAFMTNFYTDQEQLTFMTTAMETAFNTLNISMPKTNDEFRTLLETMDTGTEEGAYLYGQVLLLAESFNQMTTASENLQDATTNAIQGIADAWLGNLSYLTLKQKADFASAYLSLSRSINVTDSVDAAQAFAELSLKTARTKEEYIPVFDKYIKELERQVEDATNRDLLVELQNIKDEVVELRNVTIYATA